MYHIIWIPKYRYKVLVDVVDEYLMIKMDEVRKKYPESEYLKRNIRKTTSHGFLLPQASPGLFAFSNHRGRAFGTREA
jgi:hypothetical protein